MGRKSVRLALNGQFAFATSDGHREVRRGLGYCQGNGVVGAVAGEDLCEALAHCHALAIGPGGYVAVGERVGRVRLAVPGTLG
jgi:hypothetical protein